MKKSLVALRIFFVLAAILAMIAGVQLYILTDHTDHYFAWTIKQPLAGAFIGANFWAGACLVLWAAAEPIWANIRVAVAALSFAYLVLAATLLHLDRLHFQTTDTTALVATWAWFIVYVTTPTALLILLVLQWRVPGQDPERKNPVSRIIRALITINALIALVAGFLLFFLPSLMLPIWPWDLTPLNAQVIGSGFLSIFTASVQFLFENDWRRLRVGTVAYALIGILNLIGLARYAGAFKWSFPLAWLYLLFMLAVVIGGVYATIEARRVRN
jgi:hypothetical protein